ncbi:MAG: sugar phosphate isomerase/epimerase [Kiritimatiellia bacterium]
MPRPVTLFTGQWADLSIKDMVKKAKTFGYDGLELACWGDHFEVDKALSDSKYCATPQAPEGQRTEGVRRVEPPRRPGRVRPDRRAPQADPPPHVWGDGKPAGAGARAAEEMIKTGQAAAKLGVKVVNGFTGSPIWHLLYSFPPVSDKMIDDGYKARQGVEADPRRVPEARRQVRPRGASDRDRLRHRLRRARHRGGRRPPRLRLNYDPSHLGYCGVDYVEFIHRFKDCIFHAYMKDVRWATTPKLSGVFGGHLPFGDPRRFWEFRSVGRGCINFELIIRALNDIRYAGPLSVVEWEDGAMDREFGATESCAFLRKLDFPGSNRAFDAAFSEG